MLDEEHFLGAGREAGDRLCQFVTEHGELVVQLRRFLVLEKARRPNLASQCLGLGLHELPAAWLALHGYRPLMAESFSDPESHAGTVYRATNWTCAGDTKGFSQDHTDYYLPNERPKKLWLKPLDPKAATLMCAPQLPDNCLAGTSSPAARRKNPSVSALRSGSIGPWKTATIPSETTACGRRTGTGSGG